MRGVWERAGLSGFWMTGARSSTGSVLETGRAAALRSADWLHVHPLSGGTSRTDTLPCRRNGLAREALGVREQLSFGICGRRCCCQRVRLCGRGGTTN